MKLFRTILAGLVPLFAVALCCAFVWGYCLQKEASEYHFIKQWQDKHLKRSDKEKIELINKRKKNY